MEYLSRAPHQCKFRLTETSKVFNRTVHELPEFNAHRAGLGWAAVARYAAHLLNQPWRKEYRLLRVRNKVFNRTVHELPEFNAHRAGLGWVAVVRYAAHLLN
ncbi:Uncharacterized protein OBRU01_11730 [Operophtera brumata]|uniref:Uncharacterized protein n=1 Tax=Operophtera brumata TaxID=104452 RepID=A0A0L7LC93_OPEBR|nr:Uncharacterized protein OBRU01_11730 [Operophtera brumata]